MGDDEAALLAAIASDPTDDSLHLAYADWLSDHGGAVLAGYIRHQVVGIAALGTGSTQSLLDRAAELAAAGPRAFAARVPVAIAPHVTSGAGYERGLPAEVWIGVTECLAVAGELFRAVPVTRLTLTDSDPRLGELLARPELHRLRRLTLRAPVTSKAVEELVVALEASHRLPAAEYAIVAAEEDFCPPQLSTSGYPESSERNLLTPDQWQRLVRWAGPTGVLRVVAR